MKKLPLIFAFALCILVGRAMGALSSVPPNIVSTTQNKPMVLLTASKDYTMFWKAYTDFEDLNFDGTIDYTFRASFSYYGYFDPNKCYTYSTANSGRFQPYGPVSTASADAGLHYCTAGSGQWSGNFLNWATMTRMDVLRKILYGGLRSYYGADQATRTANGDTTTDTTLEESFVPRNSQTVVKYYNGSDLARLTPFNSANAVAKGITMCRRHDEDTVGGLSQVNVFTPVIRVVVGNVALWNMTETRSCNWSTELNYTWEPYTVAFLLSNYTTPIGVLGSTNSNYAHKSSVPVMATDGATYSSGASVVGPTFTARVQACVAGMLESNCEQYGSVWKPTGLLHKFGESAASGSKAARAEFGLMMGSYDHNITAGMLRKNIGEINDEINSATGQFVKLGSGKGGIIQSLNEITLYGYHTDTGLYDDTCQSDQMADGRCPSWGNPVGELFLESLRYYAGKSAQFATNGTKDASVGLPSATWIDPLSTTFDRTVINGGQSRFSLYGRGICRRLNTISISGGVNSYDNNGMGLLSDITSTTTAAVLTKNIGDQEGITGTARLVGNVSSTLSATSNQCTGKTISDLGSVTGVCPDGPNFYGSYLLAGAAHFANTNRIRSDLDTIAAGIPDLPYNALTVRNYGVTMAGSIANIQVPLPPTAGSNSVCVAGALADPICPRVYITPASLDYQRTGCKSQTGCTGTPLPANLIDFRILSTAVDANGFASGSALVLWQHSMLGEDQDQDQLDSIRWRVGGTAAAPTLTIWTQAIEANTGSASPFGFGYTLVGTDADGLYMHSGINNWVSNTAASISASAVTSGSSCPVPANSTSDKLCSRLTSSGAFIRGETYKTFNMTGSTNAMLHEPLWYATKYGGFNYTAQDKQNAASAGTSLYPTRLNQWNRLRADGTPCTGTASDPCSGNPDNYFFARRPDLLSTALEKILEDIVTSSNTAPAISSSQLQQGTLKVVASFNSTDGSGALRAYALDSTGTFAAVGAESWSADAQLTNTRWDVRQVITNQNNAGIGFQWGNLSAASQAILQGVNNAAYGQQMLQWLRGDTSNASLFRTRPSISVLGPIVNSNPAIERRPNGRYFGSAFPGYSNFVSTWLNRRVVLWVGADDGMLHGFDTSNSNLGGTPILSYVPDAVLSNLPSYASPGGAAVQPLVDGSPFVGDVLVNGTWSTYLFSSLGRGGKEVFALDVTNAGTVSTDANNVATVSGSQLDEAHAASIFKWKLTDADDADLGYIVSEPTTNSATNQPSQIAMMNNGRFAALFGNGAESKNGNAALFIVFADGSSAGNGGKYVKLVVPTNRSSTCTQPATPYAGYCNGLSQVAWVDTNNDRIADYVYAGDLQGNVWRFDVTSTDATKWSVSYYGQPLFKAVDANGNALPITGAPVIHYHPLGGLMVDVVTGAALYTADFPNTNRTNAIFGIWDDPKFTTSNYGSASAMAAALPRGLSKLATRTLVNVNGDDTTRYVTGNAIDWSSAQGWVLPLNASSEMGLNNLSYANNQLLTVTVSPAPALTGAATDPCTAAPVARLLGVDPITGLPNGLLGTADIIDPTAAVSKTPVYGALPNYMTVILASIPVADQKGQFVSDLVGRGSTQAGCANGSLNCTAYEGATSSGTNPRLSSSLNSGRIFWREIPGFTTR